MGEQFFVYLFELLGKPVVDRDGRAVGKFYDFSMSLNNDIYPRAKSIIVCSGWFPRLYAEIFLVDVLRVEGKIFLKIPASSVMFQAAKIASDFALRRDVLDQQVVDVENKKVVRVNDVHMLKVDQQYHIAHVDVGLRALVRRLDLEPWVDAVIRLFHPAADYLKAEELVSWKNSQVLTLGNQKNVLKLDVARAKIAIK